MAYQVLARRLRPQRFADVIGQEHVTRTLRAAIESGRVAHAFLFSGPHGVGKTTVARLLAKALNCEQGTGPEPCTTCSNCREIAEGSGFDVLEIDGASHTQVDKVRELMETVGYRPAKSRYKVYIIDEVHMLSTHSFNALLKTLEEPPPHVKFIFATTEPQRLLPTILSRCQRYDFRRVGLGELRAFLARIAAAEGWSFSEDALALIAREAEGSVRDALSLLEQVVAAAGEAPDEKAVRAALGAADRRLVAAVGEALLAGDAARCLELVDELYQHGYEPRRFCHDLLEHVRHLTVLAVTGNAGLLADLPEAERKEIERQARLRHAEDLQRAFRVLAAAEEEIGRATDPKLMLEMALVRVATLPALVPIEDILARIESLEEAGRGGGASSGPGPGKVERPRAGQPAAPRPRARRGVRSESWEQGQAAGGAASSEARSHWPGGTVAEGPGAARRSAPAASAGEADVAAEGSVAAGGGEAGRGAAAEGCLWQDFLALVRRERVSLFMKLGSATFAGVDEGRVRIAVENEVVRRELSGREDMGQLRDLAQRFFGRPLEVEICRPAPAGGAAQPEPAGEAAQSAPASAAPADPQQRLAQEALSDPLVQAAMEIFGGQVRAVRSVREPS